MELLATVVEVGAYSERQYQRQDGTTEYFNKTFPIGCTIHSLDLAFSLSS